MERKKRQLNKAYQVTDEKKVYEFKANEKLFDGKVKKEETPLLKAQKKAEKVSARAEKARRKIKKESGAEFKPDGMKGALSRTARSGKFAVRQKTLEDGGDNAAVQGMVTMERTADNTYHFVDGAVKHHHAKQAQKLAHLEAKEVKAGAEVEYRRFLQEHPEANQGSGLQKQFQKNRIKREYAKALKNGAEKEAVAEAASKGRKAATDLAKKLQEFVANHRKLFVIIGATGLMFLTIMSTFSSCGAVFSQSTSQVMAGAYLSEPVEVDAADLSFTEREARLELQIGSIEEDYPDYDEYDYNLAEIGHNPATLIGYLSAHHTQFTAAGVEAELQELFEAMYTLTLTPETETRYRDKTDEDGNVIINEETGEAEQEAYTVEILHVKLERTPLEAVVAERMDVEESQLFDHLYETRGLLQVYGTPLALYWYNYVSSYYGYRADPFDGTLEFHRGVDIAVPTGTSVYSGQDGTVTHTGYDADGYGNYIVIENAEGYMSKYAHLDRILVSSGQSVRRGDLIARSGNTGASTGSHLHIECLYNGEYYNPLFYFEAGEGTLYGEEEDRGIQPGNPEGVDPPGSYDDAQVQRLMDEATRYLGRAYVWGGSSPSTGFDCSGFVCWVYTQSGTHNLPRTTAQGIYNQSRYVSPASAKPGDLIFFSGTYNSSNPVTHVGIYCGDGVMLHCGDPIKYSNINTPYWQQHFYSFGRL